MNWLPPLQLRPLQLRPLQLRPFQLRPFQLPPRLNVAPPRDAIDMCPWPWPPPPPRRGPAFTGDAVNVTAANQLKENMSFAFIEYFSVLSCFRPSLISQHEKRFLAVLWCSQVHTHIVLMLGV